MSLDPVTVRDDFVRVVDTLAFLEKLHPTALGDKLLTMLTVVEHQQWLFDFISHLADFLKSNPAVSADELKLKAASLLK